MNLSLLLFVPFILPFFLVRTVIYYSEMLIFSPSMPLYGFRWSSHAAVHAFLDGGGCSWPSASLLFYEVISSLMHSFNVSLFLLLPPDSLCSSRGALRLSGVSKVFFFL
jgi:hypothetical protein